MSSGFREIPFEIQSLFMFYKRLFSVDGTIPKKLSFSDSRLISVPRISDFLQCQKLKGWLFQRHRRIGIQRSIRPNRQLHTHKSRHRQSLPHYLRTAEAAVQTACNPAFRRQLPWQPERRCLQKPRQQRQWSDNPNLLPPAWCAWSAIQKWFSVRRLPVGCRNGLPLLGGIVQQVHNGGL